MSWLLRQPVKIRLLQGDFDYVEVRPYRVREADRLDVVPYHAGRQLGGWRPL
jgi:hypothetical protein